MLASLGCELLADETRGRIEPGGHGRVAARRVTGRARRCRACTIHLARRARILRTARVREFGDAGGALRVQSWRAISVCVGRHSRAADGSVREAEFVRRAHLVGAARRWSTCCSGDTTASTGATSPRATKAPCRPAFGTAGTAGTGTGTTATGHTTGVRVAAARVARGVGARDGARRASARAAIARSRASLLAGSARRSLTPSRLPAFARASARTLAEHLAIVAARSRAEHRQTDGNPEKA